MTLRKLIPLAVLLAGCPGATPGTKDTDTDTTPPEPTGDTGPTEPDLDFPALHVFLSADFGWDAETQSIRYPTTNGYEIASRIEWIIATDAFLVSPDPYSETDEYCYIDMVFPEGPAAYSPTAQADPTAYFGVDHSGLAADIFTNCNDKDHNIGEMLGDVDIAAALAASTDPANGGIPYGIAIGAHSDDFVTVYLDVGDTAEDWANTVGARVYNTNFFWGITDGSGIARLSDDIWYAYPIALDAKTFEAQVDGNYYVLVPPEDVYDGVQLATAWYRISPFYGVILSQTF